MADPKISKRALMAMSWEEQVEALFDLIAYVRDEQADNQTDDRNQRANDKREHIELANEIKYVKGELHGIGRRRDKTLSTSDKMNAVLTKQMAWLYWLRDHVLAPVLEKFLQIVLFAIIVIPIWFFLLRGKIP